FHQATRFCTPSMQKRYGLLCITDTLFSFVRFMIVAVITISLFVLYSILLLYLGRSWKRIPEAEEFGPASIKLSVIIPARNEEGHIGNLLQALELQDYLRQNFEVIVVDDSSEDSTASIVNQFGNVKLIRL